MRKGNSLLDKADLGQAIIRFFLSFGVLGYTAWFEFDTNSQSDPLLFKVAIGFFLFASINLISFWIGDVPALLRRPVCIFVDTGIVTFSMSVFGEAAAPFFGGYLWVTIANGLRFGQLYMYASWVLSVIGFIIVMTLSTYWQEQATIGFGILVWLILLPLYFSKLLHSLEQTVESEKKANSIKSQFMANMSHELRTPLNAIIGYSEMLIEDAEKSGEKQQYEDLTKIRHAAHVLLNLINGVLDLSKIESGMMTIYIEDVDLITLSDEVCGLIRPQVEKNNNTLVCEVDKSIGVIKTDYSKIKQVLLNLLSNAAKFTCNGEVRLEIKADTSFNKQCVAIRVVDNGIGMSEEGLDRLFEPFTQADASTTRKFGGTGLGLTITKGFIEMLHGKLYVESEPGKGTVFSVFLSNDFSTLKDNKYYNRVAQQKRFDPNTAEERRKKIARVLAFTAEASLQELLQRYFSSAGFDIEVASSGKQALQRIGSSKPDVVLVDSALSDVNCMVMARGIRQDNILHNIPVVLLTPGDEKPVAEQDYFCSCVKKPVDLKILKDILIGCVRKA